MIRITIDIGSYIADPYWPERERVINIQKESGMNRARSTANRRKALEDHLRANGMTLKDYDDLVALAERPFYTSDDDTGFIIVPKKQVDGMLVAMCDNARAAMRPCPPEMVRTVIRATQWTTDAKPDQAKVWERYAVVSGGSGARLSNQRALRRNQYIGSRPPEGPATHEKVTATGTVDLNPEMVRPEVLRKALEWAGEWIGIGACRKMGFGRYEVVGFDTI